MYLVSTTAREFDFGRSAFLSRILPIARISRGSDAWNCRKRCQSHGVIQSTVAGKPDSALRNRIHAFRMPERFPNTRVRVWPGVLRRTTKSDGRSALDRAPVSVRAEQVFQMIQEVRRLRRQHLLTGRNTWNYTPRLPVRVAPYWDWPARPIAAAVYLLRSWNPVGMRFLFLLRRRHYPGLLHAGASAARKHWRSTGSPKIWVRNTTNTFFPSRAVCISCSGLFASKRTSSATTCAP